MSIEDEFAVRDVPEHGRFEITVHGAPAGFAEYHRDGDVVSLPHTVIEPALRGRGLGAVLATAALDQLKSQGAQVLPYCWFVRDVIAADPATYLEMVPPDRRALFGLPAG